MKTPSNYTSIGKMKVPVWINRKAEGQVPYPGEWSSPIMREYPHLRLPERLERSWHFRGESDGEHVTAQVMIDAATGVVVASFSLQHYPVEHNQENEIGFAIVNFSKQFGVAVSEKDLKWFDGWKPQELGAGLL